MKRVWNYLKLLYKNGGMPAVYLTVQRILNGILPNIQVIATSFIVDNLILVLSGKSSLEIVYFWIFVLVTIVSCLWISDPISSFFEVKFSNNLRENYKIKIVDKCARIKYKYYEDQNTLDLIERITSRTENEMCNDLKMIINLLSLVIRVVGLICLIGFSVWWCGIIIAFLIFPLIVLSKKNGEVFYNADKDMSLHKRKTNYLEDILINKDSAAERNLFQFSEFVRNIWSKEYKITIHLYIKAFLSYFYKIKLYSILALVLCFVMIGFLFIPLLDEKITLGLFISIVSSLLSLITVALMQITQYIKEIEKQKGYATDLYNFENLFEEKGALDNPAEEVSEFHSIEFKNVDFCYPGTSKLVLNNLSFRIESGKHYAFVGPNGAGKSTIIKLLTGLYNEYEGEILINDKELRTYEAKELKALFSIVFQDFARYNISLYDFLTLGLGADKCENNRIAEVLEELQLLKVIDHMPKGYKTILGKLTDDAYELSSGQWQRLALARTLIKNAPLKVLDEPTAALDPKTECHIYQEYSKFSTGVTTLFITHRLGSVVLADEILVFDNGKLVEHGAFQELMKIQGLFFDMYKEQRRWYE